MIASPSAINVKTPAPGTDCFALAAPLAEIMRELRELLGNLSSEQYSARAGDLFANSTIGGHVRHCLDHARTLVDGWRTGIVDYDHRARGTNIETDLAAADAELIRLIDSVERLAKLDADDSIGVSVMPTRDGLSITLSSTLARELAFVLSHTIHHNATIRGIALSLGSAVPASFGYAPSTLAHHDGVGSTRCAR
jgi:uncharacterized damage-inducible protein DinB